MVRPGFPQIGAILATFLGRAARPRAGTVGRAGVLDKGVDVFPGGQGRLTVPLDQHLADAARQTSFDSKVL